MARQRVPEGPAPDPAVQKIRLRYARRGRLRFSSTRDFQRALERAIRRAGVPVAFTAGFHPHPKISYANTAPTGVASEAEFFEISLTRQIAPERLARAIDDALPAELVVLEAVTARDGALADRLEASVWRLDLPAVPQDADAVGAAVTEFLARDVIEVRRMTKTGEKTIDVRAATVGLRMRPGTARPGEGGPGIAIEAVVRHTVPTVRPGDLLSALTECGLPRDGGEPLATRLAQGPLSAEGTVQDPLAAEREQPR